MIVEPEAPYYQRLALFQSSKFFFGTIFVVFYMIPLAYTIRQQPKCLLNIQRNPLSLTISQGSL